jgi:hypothetical protein
VVREPGAILGAAADAAAPGLAGAASIP